MTSRAGFWQLMAPRLVALVAILSACGQGDASPSTECLEVPADALAHLNRGLEPDSVQVTRAAAVRSPRRFNNWEVFMISGELSGRELDAGPHVGTWAQFRRLGPTMTVAVAGAAMTASEFGTAGENPEWRSTDFPGVIESIECLDATATDP